MPFRDKAKSLFKTNKSRTESDTLSKSSSKESDRERWPSNVYKPGEPMPRPKYRATPKKEHKERLEAFSFAEAWRRKSFQSQYSPMGTRASSRRNSVKPASRQNSIFSIGRRSISGRSDTGRTGSVTSAETEKSTLKPLGAAKAPALDTEPEQEGDDDIANVGISKAQTVSAVDAGPNRPIQLLSMASDHHPFTEHELAQALQRSHLAVSAHS